MSEPVDLREIFLRPLTVILFMIIGFLAVSPFAWSQAYTSLLLLFLNLIIILSAIYFDARAVIVFGFFSLLLLLLQSLRISEWESTAFFLLIITTCVCYVHSLKGQRQAHKIHTELESIEEERNVLSVEIEHLRRINSSLSQKFRRYATLKELTETLSSVLTPEDTFSLIAAEAYRIVGKSACSRLYLVDENKQKLKLVNTRFKDLVPQIQDKEGDAFDNWVLRNRTRLIIKDANKDFRFSPQDAEENLHSTQSLIAAPLISQNKLVGILRLDNVMPEAYDADDLRLLDIIADLGAVAIENTLLYQKMEKLAISDGLTGLFVQRHFQQRFNEEIARALWTNSQFSFLMLDIDNFKSYNDRYGHIAGDIVLKEIAKLIAASIDPGDIAARYGGEEFAVLLVNTTKGEAAKLAERIRERIEKQAFVLRREITEVRISGGLSSFPGDGKVKENLIRLADEALYEAKARGKNRICVV